MLLMLMAAVPLLESKNIVLLVAQVNISGLLTEPSHHLSTLSVH